MKSVRPTIAQLDRMWSKAVKLRAGNKSEYSQKESGLNSHHIEGKGTHRLRWELDNGICLTGGEHKYIAHRQDRAADFRKWAMKKRGITEDDVTIWKRQLGGIDRFAMYLYLKEEIKKYEKRSQENE